MPVDDASGRRSLSGSLPRCPCRPHVPPRSAGGCSAATSVARRACSRRTQLRELAPGGGCGGTSTPTPRSGDHRLLHRGRAPGRASGRGFTGLHAPSSCGAAPTSRRPTTRSRSSCRRARAGSPVPGVARPDASGSDGDVVAGRAGCRRTGRVRTAVDLIRRGQRTTPSSCSTACVTARPRPAGRRADAVAALPRCRGSALARRVARLADGLAESPPETAAAAAPASARGCRRPSPSSGSFDDDGLHRAGRLRVPGAEDRHRVRRALARRAGSVRARTDAGSTGCSRPGGGSCFVTAADLHDPARCRAGACAAERRAMINARGGPSSR